LQESVRGALQQPGPDGRQGNEREHEHEQEREHEATAGKEAPGMRSRLGPTGPTCVSSVGTDRAFNPGAAAVGLLAHPLADWRASVGSSRHAPPLVPWKERGEISAPPPSPAKRGEK